MFKAVLALALLPTLALASPQVYGAPPPSDSTPAAAPSAPPSTSTQMNVDVAAGGNFVFSPNNIQAANGTLVTFFFPSGATPHSVTQGDFSNPCEPLSGGFDSGLQNSKQFTLNVTNDQIPIYFFCKSPTHCGLGMVGTINAPSSGNTGDAWQSAAIKVGSSEQTLQDNGFVSGGVGAVATAAPSSSSSGASRLAVSGVAVGALSLAAAVLFA